MADLGTRAEPLGEEAQAGNGEGEGRCSIETKVSLKLNKTPAQVFTLASRLVKYHRDIPKNNLKHVDVPHFLTAVTS